MNIKPNFLKSTSGGARISSKYDHPKEAFV